MVGGLCDFGVTPVPIGLGFGFGTAPGFGLGLRGPDLGLGLDNTFPFRILTFGDKGLGVETSVSGLSFSLTLRKMYFMLKEGRRALQQMSGAV